MELEEKKKTILLIEDDEELQSLFEEELSKNGYDVITCAKVSEALWRLRQGPMNLILTDLHLKDGNGDQIIETVRKDKKGFNYKTPIMVISGHLDHGTIQDIATKISGALVKPVEPWQLIERVNSLCGA